MMAKPEELRALAVKKEVTIEDLERILELIDEARKDVGAEQIRLERARRMLAEVIDRMAGARSTTPT